MRAFLVSALLLPSAALAGTTASITSSVKQEDKFNLGVSFAAYTKGLAYWTWNGYGQDDGEHWGSSQHGIDFTVGPVKFGPTVEFKLEEQDQYVEPGFRVNVKLW
jgi:hypothetical protein